MMRFRLLLNPWLIMLIISIVVVSVGSSQLKQVAAEDSAASKRFNPFDWSYFRQLFNKKYSSLSQELIRKKIFMASAVKVFISAVKYRFNLLNYYIKINRYSDATPNETTEILSGAAGVEPQQQIVGQTQSDTTTHMLDDEQVEALLLDSFTQVSPASDARSIQYEIRAERADAFAKIKRRRRKRSASDSRRLRVEQLVRIEDDSWMERLDPNMKLDAYSESNNPNYEPIEPEFLDPELHASDFVADVSKEDVAIVQKESDALKSESQKTTLLTKVFKAASNWISGAEQSLEGDEPMLDANDFFQDDFADDDDDDDEDILPDDAVDDETIVIRDWRKTGCVGPARFQGHCSSCYAVSVMTHAEWAWCMNQNRTFTPLSVQYMVSCGPQFKEETNGSANLNGCRRAVTAHALEFIKDYGIELEANMPYLERDTMCPIPKQTPRKNKGYIRPNVKQTIRMRANTEKLDLALKLGPVLVTMNQPKDFLHYGGGFIDSCHEKGGHAMIIVGNMIEDGVEYLLIQNSFGPFWGYRGLFKFPRSAIGGCVKEFILPRLAFPSKKSQNRRMKAYEAERSGESLKEILDEEYSVGVGHPENKELLFR